MSSQQGCLILFPGLLVGLSSTLSSPCSLVVDTSVWATSPLGVAFRCVFCVFFFFSHPGFVALWDSKTPHRPASERVSCCLETSPPSQLPPWEGSLFLFCLSFCLLYFVLPTFEKNRLPFWVPGVLYQCSEVALWKLFSIQMMFWWICRGESGLPVIFLCYLGTAHRTLQLLFSWSFWEYKIIIIFWSHPLGFAHGGKNHHIQFHKIL